jgi:hypothetical protein
VGQASWLHRARVFSPGIGFVGIPCPSRFPGKAGNRGLPAPSTRFPIAAISNCLRTTDWAFRTPPLHQGPRQPHLRFHTNSEITCQHPYQPRPPFHANLGMTRQHPYQPCPRFHSDNRGFVSSDSGPGPAELGSFGEFRGLVRAGLGSFAGRGSIPPPNRLPDRQRWVRFVNFHRRASLPIRQLGSFDRIRMPGHLRARRSGGTGETVPGPIAGPR